MVQTLCALIRLRNRHSAFQGEFVLQPSRPDELSMRWQNGAAFAELTLRFTACSYELRTSPEAGASWSDCLNAPKPEG
ncbi:MAG: hypothetical protein ACTS5I_02780 [Rhodanobacter sp.]